MRQVAVEGASGRRGRQPVARTAGPLPGRGTLSVAIGRTRLQPGGPARRARRRGLALLSLVLTLTVPSTGLVAGIVQGDHGAAIVDAVGRTAGLHVRYVKLTGQKETSDSAILAAVGVSPDSSILTVDATAARERLVALPWVREAEVRKIYPGVIEVTIEEAEAFARWSRQGTTAVIDRAGRVLTTDIEARFMGLPLVVGEGAGATATELIEALADFPAVAERTAAFVRINDRRWDLMLDTSTTIQLPARSPMAALARLERLHHSNGVLDGDFAVIDLRLSDRTTVRTAPLDMGGPEPAGSEPVGNGRTVREARL